MLKFIQQELEVQYQRYYRTRYGKIAAIIICYFLITQTPHLLNYIIPQLGLYFSPQISYIVIIVSLITTVTVLFFIFMYFVYTSKLQFFEQYRANKDVPWPWQVDPAKWRQLLTSSIKTTLLFMWIVVPILLTFSVNVDFYVIMDMSVSPTSSHIVVQLIILYIFDDISFFLAHRALHHPTLYKYHKVHHEYTTTITTAGLYSHIVQFLLSNSISTGIYLKIMSLLSPLHITTVVIWYSLKMHDAYCGHSGYIFSWWPYQLLPFCSNDQFHDFHHSRNCGNYGGSFRILDTIFGTNKEFNSYKKAQRQKQKLQ